MGFGFCGFCGVADSGFLRYARFCFVSCGVAVLALCFWRAKIENLENAESKVR